MAIPINDAFGSIGRHLDLISQSTAAYSNVLAELIRSTSAITSLQTTLATQFERDRALFGNTSALLSQARLVPGFTSNFSDLCRVNANLTSLVSAASINDSKLSKIFADHSGLRESIASIAAQSSVTQLLSSLDTTRLLHTSLSSQYRLINLETASFGCKIDASKLLANDLTSTFGKFTSSYRDLVELIPSFPESYVPFIAKYSPIEYSLELDVLEQISVDSAEESRDGLPSVDEELASFNDELLVLINGARQSLTSDNPDKARHVTTSVRELFTQILHGLAPDAQVGVWSKDKNHFHNGRPTRRARLLFICRKFSCDALTKFVEDDVQAVLTLVDTLNAGTHVVQSKLTECQLEAIVYRMETLALYLLKVSKGA